MNNWIHSFFEFSKDLILGIVHGLLLLPVLYLFLEINQLAGFYPLVFFFSFTQLTAAVSKKRWLYFLIETCAALFFFYRSFPYLRSGTIMGWFMNLWQYSIDEWTLLTSETAVELPLLLIFSALLLLFILLTYTSIYKKLAFPSFLTAFSYLLILNIFTGHAILNYTVSVVGFGILILGLMRIDMQLRPRHFFKTSILTTLLTIGLVGAAYWSIERLRPVQEWIESSSIGYQRSLDERGFFEWINSQSSGSGVRRTGMGTNDEQLGGPLQNDYSRLFQAYTDEPHYWKVLHRWEYTGSGWNSDTSTNPEHVFSPYTSSTYYSGFGENPEAQKESATATVIWEEPIQYLAYPYGWNKVDIRASATEYVFMVDRYIDYHTISSGYDTVKEYTINYDEAFPGRLDEDILRQDDGWRQRLIDQIDQEETGMMIDPEAPIEEQVRQVATEEVQLPENFPQRVTDLALELTEGLESEYEMVRAIESYLKREGNYRYSLQDAVRTPEGEDYVEHFLFESLVGYCDNFSTAMTTMLRAAGIPARWVKGFTPGSQQASPAGDTYYQISNANAHSWTEVYFPSVGWVPFEPSPSFANPITRTATDVSPEDDRFSFDDTDTLEANPPAEELSPEIDQPAEEELEEETAETEVTEGSASNVTSDSEDSASRISIRWLSLSITALLAVLVLAGYFFSLHFKSAAWILEKLIQKNALSLPKACLWTLRLFEAKMKRPDDQTLHYYFEEWTAALPERAAELTAFAALSDQAFYGRKLNQNSIQDDQKQILSNALRVLTTFKNPAKKT